MLVGNLKILNIKGNSDHNYHIGTNVKKFKKILHNYEISNIFNMTEVQLRQVQKLFCYLLPE